MLIRNLTRFDAYNIALNDGKERYWFYIGQTGSLKKQKHVLVQIQQLSFDNSRVVNQSSWSFINYSDAFAELKHRALTIIGHSNLTPGEQRRYFPESCR